MELPKSWQCVFTLAERWGYSLTAADGNSEEEIEDLEIPLPYLVQLWYQRIGNCERLYHHNSQSHLTPLSKLEITSFADTAEDEDLPGTPEDYPRRLMIYEESQYVFGWVILECDLALPDPPVYLEDVDQVFSEEEVLISAAACFSDFAAQILAFELLHQATSAHTLEKPSIPFSEIAPTLTAVVESPLIYSYPNELELWYSDNLLIATENREWFSGVALTEQAKAEFESWFST